MKCAVCPRTHRDGHRLLRNNNRQWSCWEHLTKEEQDKYTTKNKGNVFQHRAMTQREVNEHDLTAAMSAMQRLAANYE